VVACVGEVTPQRGARAQAPRAARLRALGRKVEYIADLGAAFRDGAIQCSAGRRSAKRSVEELVAVRGIGR